MCKIIQVDQITKSRDYDIRVWLAKFLHPFNKNINYWPNFIDRIYKNNGFLYIICLYNDLRKKKLEFKVICFRILYEIMELYNLWSIQQYLHKFII